LPCSQRKSNLVLPCQQAERLLEPVEPPRTFMRFKTACYGTSRAANMEQGPFQSAFLSMQKPRLTFWQIWNMSFGFLGIQFGWGLQMANMGAIYEYLGARADQIPILWLAAPLTGLLVQPIIGHASDRTWGPLGRRRPYFLTGAILSSLALILMPHSSALWMAAGLLWILDASINISMEPFRAFVADKLDVSQRAAGFGLQSVFLGAGACLAEAVP